MAKNLPSPGGKVKAALLLVLCCMGCATAPSQATQGPASWRCLPVGSVPGAPEWWVYVCTIPRPPVEKPLPPAETEES